MSSWVYTHLFSERPTKACLSDIHVARPPVSVVNSPVHTTPSLYPDKQAISSFLERFRPLQQAAATVRPWLLNVQPARQDAVLQLFCFPPAGRKAQHVTPILPTCLAELSCGWLSLRCPPVCI